MALAALQSGPLLTWFKFVNDTVTEPYLDEVFHVRQAQHYCRNEFDVWDPKITTPPALYLLSYVLSPIVGCELVWLRLLNVFCITALQAVISWTYTLRGAGSKHTWNAQHSAVNVALFPPLFFFAALYYTDVPSTLSVMVFYCLLLHFDGQTATPWLRVPTLSLAGMASILFRQTNVFWVAIFPAGILLVDELDQGHQAVRDSMQRHSEGFGDSIASVARASWKLDAVYDTSVKDASLIDFVKTVVSIFVCTAKVFTKPQRLSDLLRKLLPCLIILLSFATFVVYNGGVVLGDKSNHIATLHLPQLLYIWPYFAFFSWPLIYPYLAIMPFSFFAKLPNVTSLESMLMFRRRGLVPNFTVLAAFSVAAAVVVHFNTIVHPFTLADNRHYTFYVFKRLMHPPWLKYAVAPIYILCGWACIQALGARPVEVAAELKQKRVSDTTSQSPKEATVESRKLSLPDGHNGATTSFVIIWLATSALQLITAPLVEPRYLILPWIFWRLHLPLQQHNSTQQKEPATLRSKLAAADHRLCLETVWMLTVNVVTGYMFLYRGFEWPQEAGKAQRFMW